MVEVPSVRWETLDEDLREAYARHVALQDQGLRREIGAESMSEVTAFYNSYLWLLLFVKWYQARYGYDAGIEQEAFRMLENAPLGVDWGVVERVNEAARVGDY